MTFEFKIQLKDVSKPPVWRRLQVPADFTFSKLHEVIQAAFGWDNNHLYKFCDKEYNPEISITLSDKEMYGEDYSEDDDDWGFINRTTKYEAAKTTLNEIFDKTDKKLLYIYDFGDYWVHKITLEKTIDANTEHAICIAGKGACPPENCGGANGYFFMKDTLKNHPDSEEANEIREWLGITEDEEWESAYSFNLEETNFLVGNI